jgi:hypothetical protein
MADVYITELFNLFPELPELIQEAVIKATKKAAFDIQRLAAVGPPRDTGFMKSSIYVVTKDSSTYGQNLEGDGELLPEVERPESPTIAYIAVGADYGIYQELGTVNMPAQPYLLPAAEAVFPEYMAALETLERLLYLP